MVVDKGVKAAQCKASRLRTKQRKADEAFAAAQRELLQQPEAIYHHLVHMQGLAANREAAQQHEKEVLLQELSETRQAISRLVAQLEALQRAKRDFTVAKDEEVQEAHAANIDLLHKLADMQERQSRLEAIVPTCLRERHVQPQARRGSGAVYVANQMPRPAAKRDEGVWLPIWSQALAAHGLGPDGRLQTRRLE